MIFVCCHTPLLDTVDLFHGLTVHTAAHVTASSSKFPAHFLESVAHDEVICVFCREHKYVFEKYQTVRLKQEGKTGRD